jgi:glycosyltransferase involved in cell wall biosynthesis
MWQASKAVGGFDVLHSNSPFIVQGLGVPSVLTVHHVVASLQHDISKRALQGELNPVLRFKERRAVNRADRIVTVSAQSKRDLSFVLRRLGPEVVPILNGIPFEPYQFSDAELTETRARFAPARNGTLLVTAPNRLDDERKGLKYLFEALRQLSPRSTSSALILGRGARSLPGVSGRRAPFGRLEFPGFVDLEVKRKLMAAADLFVLPSTLEGCPISLLEAMAAGRPVVASRVGGIPELVRSSKQGTLVPAKDPEALARAIQDLATDERRRDEIGTYNRTFAKDELSWTRAAERTLEVYESAIENARQGDRASFA